MENNSTVIANPAHIAIIMDGNGRWAQKRKLPRLAGHRAGIKSIKKIVPLCAKLEIKDLTLYAFSQENWSRPKIEIKGLMKLLIEFLGKELKNIVKDNIKLKIIGKIDVLPKKVRKILQESIDLTKHNTALTLTLALNYGGRQEIMYGVNKILKDYRDGCFSEKDISTDLFKQYLFYPEMPDPDLVIRTSGEKRISNFLLWQMSYGELYATETLWPDFEEKDLMQAIENYKKRERRFGGINPKNQTSK